MNTWAANLQDSILSNSALRGGLTDDEAQPFIDWGLQLAEQVGQQMESAAPDQVEAVFEEKKDALLKLMTRIDWIAQYQATKGAAWTTQTLQMLNDLNRTLFGESAPQLSETQITTYSTQPPASKGEAVQSLIRDLSAASTPATANEDLSIVQNQWEAVKAIFGKNKPANDPAQANPNPSPKNSEEKPTCD